MTLKSFKSATIAAVGAIALLGTSGAIAKPPGGKVKNCAPNCTSTVQAPEIDVTSGAGALAVLVTVLLIGAERARRA
jgi:hypothetical protein